MMEIRNSRLETTWVVRQLLSTTCDIHLVLFRVVLGLIFFAHGAQKVFGWFGGPGYGAIMGWFASQHIPVPLAWLAIAAELVGGLTLTIGWLGRLGPSRRAILAAAADKTAGGTDGAGGGATAGGVTAGAAAGAMGGCEMARLAPLTAAASASPTKPGSPS